MKIAGDWLSDPATQSVCAMLTGAGHQALLVGGCVRNALLGAPVTDIDIATDATPDRVVALAKAAGLKPVPTGIDHGTITVVADGSRTKSPRSAAMSKPSAATPPSPSLPTWPKMPRAATSP